MIIGVPIEYVGVRDHEIAYPSGVQRRYDFQPQPQYGGRKICVIENETDLTWFMNFVNHKKKIYRVYRVADDLQKEIYFDHMAEAILERESDFLLLMGKLGFHPEKKPTPVKRAPAKGKPAKGK